MRIETLTVPGGVPQSEPIRAATPRSETTQPEAGHISLEAEESHIIAESTSQTDQAIGGEVSLSALVEKARGIPMTDEQRNEQRNSFVYGNTKIENANVTQELVEAISRRIPLPDH